MHIVLGQAPPSLSMKSDHARLAVSAGQVPRPSARQVPSTSMSVNYKLEEHTQSPRLLLTNATAACCKLAACGKRTKKHCVAADV